MKYELLLKGEREGVKTVINAKPRVNCDLDIYKKFSNFAFRFTPPKLAS